MTTVPKLDGEELWDSGSANSDKSESVKKELFRDSWCYLHRHTELRAIMRIFLHELISKQPENIYEFSAALFNCNNYPLLVIKINLQLKRINESLKKRNWPLNEEEFTKIGSKLYFMDKEKDSMFPHDMIGGRKK